MVTIQSVCNEIIKRSIKENIEITPLKLQKIIYFIYAYGLAKYNKKWFIADFYAWKLGPVCESIYQEFKCYGNTRITSYAQDALKISYFPNWESMSNNELYECLNQVWNKYKNYQGSSLVDLTHKSNSAWKKAHSNNRINEKDMIEDVNGGLY